MSRRKISRYYDDQAEVSSDNGQLSSDESDDGDMSDATREALRQMIDDGDIEDDDAAMYAAFHNQMLITGSGGVLGRNTCRICSGSVEDKAFVHHTHSQVSSGGGGCGSVAGGECSGIAYCFMCIWNWNRVDPGRCPACGGAYAEIHHELCDGCDAVRECSDTPADIPGDAKRTSRWPHGIHGVHFTFASPGGGKDDGGFDLSYHGEDDEDFGEDDDNYGSGHRRRRAGDRDEEDLNTGELTCEICLGEAGSGGGGGNGDSGPAAAAQGRPSAALGTLLECTLCERFYHQGCLGLAAVPDLRHWSCPDCARTQSSLLQLFGKATAGLRSRHPHHHQLKQHSKDNRGRHLLRQQQKFDNRSSPMSTTIATKRIKTASGAPRAPRETLLKPALRAEGSFDDVRGKRKTPLGDHHTSSGSDSSNGRSSDDGSSSSGDHDDDEEEDDSDDGDTHAVVFVFDQPPPSKPGTSSSPSNASSSPSSQLHPQQHHPHPHPHHHGREDLHHSPQRRPPAHKSRFERRQELAQLRAAKQHQLDARRDQLLHRVHRLNREIRRRRRLAALEATRRRRRQRAGFRSTSTSGGVAGRRVVSSSPSPESKGCTRSPPRGGARGVPDQARFLKQRGGVRPPQQPHSSVSAAQRRRAVARRIRESLAVILRRRLERCVAF